MRKSARGARAAPTPGEGMVQGSETAGRAAWGHWAAMRLPRGWGHMRGRVKPTSGSKMMWVAGQTVRCCTEQSWEDVSFLVFRSQSQNQEPPGGGNQGILDWKRIPRDPCSLISAQTGE